ncbi:VanZ family protein [Listeria rustica]|uniref:VanZ family protein n=1 Tax=Listeria rustica TaxID=2713503 RepID=A0A7W1T8H9_9LIST|nr:VanZ family protein [Listeria rustica]MBA3927351.1 VanZ family protein [Listeria rustica]
MYLSSVVAITFFPLPVQRYLIESMIADKLGLEHNFIPLKIFYDMKDLDLGMMLAIFLRQVVGNILLFVPLGFSLPIIVKKFSWKKVVLTGFLISLSIELGQWLLGLYLGYNYRATDIDDLIFNTIGTFLGVLLFNSMQSILRKYELIE